MDIQALMNAVTSTAKDVRSDYHLTLGSAIKKLAGLNGDLRITFNDTNLGPCDPGSYRGYYSDLSFEGTSEIVSVGDFLSDLKDSLGKEFEGYKGGEFVMDEKTPLWFSSYGNCGPAIMDIVSTGDRVVITTKIIDD